MTEKAHSLFEAPLGVLMGVAHSPVCNYVIPGLTSWLIGEHEDGVTLRMFTASRHPREPIAPHSHRYDFRARVLTGSVEHTLWVPGDNLHGDEFEVLHQSTPKTIGDFDCTRGERGYWKPCTYPYDVNRIYQLLAEEVHSIQFDKGTIVLLEEQPDRTNSFMLNPVVAGNTLYIGDTQPWMFK